MNVNEKSEKSSSRQLWGQIKNLALKASSNRACSVMPQIVNFEKIDVYPPHTPLQNRDTWAFLKKSAKIGEFHLPNSISTRGNSTYGVYFDSAGSYLPNGVHVDRIRAHMKEKIYLKVPKTALFQDFF